MNSSRFAALGLVFVLFSQIAVADEISPKQSAEAERFFKAGLNLLKMENLKGAALEFEQAVSLQPTVSALFNLANCYKGLNQYEDAMRIFERLRKDFGDELKPAVVKAVERHETEIVRVATELEINVTPDNATIKLDGRVVGQSPLDGTLYLSPGKREIVVEAPDHGPYRKTINAFSGQKMSVSVILESTRSQVGVSANVEGATVLIDGRVIGETPMSEPIKVVAGQHRVELSKGGYLTVKKDIETQPEETVAVEFVLVPQVAAPSTMNPAVTDDKWNISTVSWVGAGLTLATGIACGVFYIVANSHFQRLKDVNDDVDTFNGQKAQSMKERERLEKDQNSSVEKTRLYANLGLGFGIGAGVLAIATGVSVALDIKRHKREKTQSPVSVGTTPTSMWLRF